MPNVHTGKYVALTIYYIIFKFKCNIFLCYQKIKKCDNFLFDKLILKNKPFILLRSAHSRVCVFLCNTTSQFSELLSFSNYSFCMVSVYEFIRLYYCCVVVLNFQEMDFLLLERESNKNPENKLNKNIYRYFFHTLKS